MTHDEIDAIIMNKFSGKDIPANISNVFEFGIEIGRHEVITELLETSKHDELSQKIAWDILERGIERGKEMVLKDVKKLLHETPVDKVVEIKCDDGEIRNRPLIDIARVYEILEKVKAGGENADQ